MNAIRRLLGGLSIVALALSGCGLNGQAAKSTMQPAIIRSPLPTEKPPTPIASLTALPLPLNPFGLMVDGENLEAQPRVNLARNLGAGYFRPWDVNVENWNGVCPDPACDLAQAAGLGLILTVRNNGGGDAPSGDPPQPTTPTQDLVGYQKTISELIDRYKPAVLVVENEEDSTSFWNGTPTEYAVELKAACEVAHRVHTLCANGGLSSETIVLLVWAGYIEDGRPAEACSFIQRADLNLSQELCSVTSLMQLPDQIRAALDTGRKLIGLYQTSGQDLVNFHWYVADKFALSEAVSYLKRATGLPPMSNEMGQRDQAPDAVDKLLAAAIDLHLPYVVWFSLDRSAQALQNEDGSLRPNGIAFRDFMQARYQSVAELPVIVNTVTPAPTETSTPAPTFVAKPAPVAAGGNLTFTSVMTDVTYCTAADGVDLKMDLYSPLKPGGPAPSIVFVHGGGWVAGTKSGTPGLSTFLELNRRGYMVASIDYRLAPTYTFPSQIQDVKCAIRSLRANAAEYNIDPNRIGAWGASAGGHLVALLGTSDQSAGWDVGQFSEQSSRVQAVVDMYGISDLTQNYIVGGDKGLSRMVFGVSDQSSEVLRKASPVTYISPDDPPFLILHGDMDGVVPITQSQILQADLIAGGVKSTFVTVHNGGHGFGAIGGPISPTYREIYQLIDGFFDQYLR